MARLVLVHAHDGCDVWVNPEHVASIRPDSMFDNRDGALITVAGSTEPIRVTDTPAALRERFTRQVGPPEHKGIA
jgi:hypothetical protein